ncbi:MAG TPA: helix-turn-helix domain-containing protein [Desulfobacteraceae bacterium]|nr:helix-turn-helix domain-containing protein [Desulfobacteraceae bacterium]
MSRTEKNTKKPEEPKEGNTSPKDGRTGDYLRTLREKRGLSIEEVCQSTRISTTNLRAIEEQNFAALPADTFTRGLLNIYAKFLEVDPADIVARFMQERDASQLQGKRFRGKSPRSLPSPKTLAEPAHVSLMFMAGLVLLIIIMLFTGFCLYTSWNPFGFLVKESYDIHAILSDTFPDTKPSPPTSGSDDLAAVSPVPDQSGIAIPAAGRIEEKPEESGHTLTLRFLTDAEVTVARDEAEPFSHAFVKGQEETWSAETSITVTFDKPDSAAVFVNNTPVDFPPGEDGSYTLRIPEDLPEYPAHE